MVFVQGEGEDKPMKAVWINSKDRWVVDVELPEGEELLGAMQKAVGGLIERVLELDDVNEVYADEEGLLKTNLSWFWMKHGFQPFAGDGIVVGHRGEHIVSTTLTAEEVKPMVRFMDMLEVAREFGPGRET